MVRVIVVAMFVCTAAAGCATRDVVNGDVPVPRDVARPPADASRTASGLAFKVLKQGRGSVRPHPKAHVLVHYTGWTTDGAMFDSSVLRGRPQAFDVEDVIPGWAEGLQLMVTGEKRRFWIPGPLAYDSLKRPGAPQGMLVFDIELLDTD